MRQVSRKRQRRDRVYPAAREAVYVRAGGRCEFVMDGIGCARPMGEVHHIAGRGGDDPHRLDNLLGLCHDHHEFVHAEPALAYEHGWMRSRHGGAA